MWVGIDDIESAAITLDNIPIIPEEYEADAPRSCRSEKTAIEVTLIQLGAELLRGFWNILISWRWQFCFNWAAAW